MLQKFDAIDGAIFIRANWGDASSLIFAAHSPDRSCNDVVDIDVQPTQWQVGAVGHDLERFLALYTADDCTGGCQHDDDDDGHDQAACAASRASDIAATEESVIEQIDVYAAEENAAKEARTDAAACWETADIHDRTKMERGQDHNYCADVTPPDVYSAEALRDAWFAEYRSVFVEAWNEIYSDAPDDEKHTDDIES